MRIEKLTNVHFHCNNRTGSRQEQGGHRTDTGRAWDGTGWAQAGHGAGMG